jgi:hypothetical protein
MCNKANHVKRFYTLMLTTPMTLKPRCIGVFKAVPSDLHIKEAAKKYIEDPIVDLKIDIKTRNAQYMVDVVPVDIPLSILF